MIILKCSKCGQQLEVDDAFAGGVCRCVHCGALSQVPLSPTRLDHKGRPLAPPQMAAPVVTLPEEQQHIQIAPTRAYMAQRKRMGLLAVIMMLAAVAMVVAAIILAMEAFKPEQKANTEAPPPEYEKPFVEVKGPAFVNLPLPAGDIAYLLNAGSSMRNVMDYATSAIEVSVKRAGERNFIIVPWQQGNTPEGQPAVYPASGLGKAGIVDGGINEWFRKLTSHDARQPGLAAAEAVARGAKVLLVITRTDLDSEVVDELLAATSGKNVVWLAAAIDETLDDVSSYPELVRLAGDAARVTVAPINRVETWLDKAPTP